MRKEDIRTLEAFKMQLYGRVEKFSWTEQNKN